MKSSQRIDVMDLTKRAILVDRKKVTETIIRGIIKRFKINVIYAWLNPIFNEQTDFIIIGAIPKSNTMVIFNAISFGECSTAQFDMYAANKNIDEFYENLRANAICIPIPVFESKMRSQGLSTNKSSDMYWMKQDSKVSKLVVQSIEEMLPQLSHIKEHHA